MNQGGKNERFLPVLEPGAGLSLSGQIHAQIKGAILDGRLTSKTRLPSWNDLASQLGVSRGTIRAAYARLTSEHLIEANKSYGTRVATVGPSPKPAVARQDLPPMPDLFGRCGQPPLPFQMGVPASDTFPTKLWSRLLTRSARRFAARPAVYGDPRGEPELRSAICAMLALSRGVRCCPSQIIVTSGYRGALGLISTLLDRSRRAIWVEDPGYVLTRRALLHAGFKPVSIPVDDEGIQVAEGRRIAPDAGAAMVTPSQQFPMGMAMSAERRRSLLGWARHAEAWIVEDDYLGELHLGHRAPAALAAFDPDNRVLHVGTFSKTVCPALDVGFLVVPTVLLARAAEIAASLHPASGTVEQLTVAEMLTGGHYLRHLRRMRRCYADRQEATVRHLRRALPFLPIRASGALLVRIDLPSRINDVVLADAIAVHGLLPAALSPFYERNARRGLLLSVTNAASAHVDRDCSALARLIEPAMA